MSDENVIQNGESAPTSTDPAAVVPATPAATAPAPATSAAEDRSTWVPPYRIRETRESALREANTEYAKREAALRAEADRYRTQLHSIVGVTPPADPEVTAVRDQFGNLYPGLSRLEERAADLERLIERANDLESQNDHYWASYGRQQVNNLFTKASESLGAPLTDSGKEALHQAFVGFVSSSPERTARYTNDPTLVDEFWNTFTSSFIDPARRVATATVAGRAAASAGLPQDTPSGAPRASLQPQPKTMDERADAAWAMYNANKRPGSQ